MYILILSVCVCVCVCVCVRVCVCTHTYILKLDYLIYTSIKDPSKKNISALSHKGKNYLIQQLAYSYPEIVQFI